MASWRRIRYPVKGKVEETLPGPEHVPDEIALLQLGTNVYEPTMAELNILSSHLAPGGFPIIANNRT